MPHKQTDKSRYPSLYSPNKYVSSHQYILELICKNKAKSVGENLDLSFWKKDKKWKDFFKSQAKLCSQLLKKYSPQAIINALRTYKGQKIFSLRAAWLEDIIKQEQKKLSAPLTIVKDYTNVHQNSAGRKPKESIIDKIRALDD